VSSLGVQLNDLHMPMNIIMQEREQNRGQGCREGCVEMGCRAQGCVERIRGASEQADAGDGQGCEELGVQNSTMFDKL
jgi:hypothetical protein